MGMKRAAKERHSIPSNPKPYKSPRSEPPAALLDLVHNFLTDYHFSEAAQTLQSEIEKKQSHVQPNRTSWKSSSKGWPALLEIYQQWTERQSERASALLKLQLKHANRGDVGTSSESESSGDSRSSNSSRGDSPEDTSSEVDNVPAQKSTMGKAAARTSIISKGLKRKASFTSSLSTSSSSAEEASSSDESESKASTRARKRPRIDNQKNAVKPRPAAEHISESDSPASSADSSSDGASSPSKGSVSSSAEEQSSNSGAKTTESSATLAGSPPAKKIPRAATSDSASSSDSFSSTSPSSSSDPSPQKAPATDILKVTQSTGGVKRKRVPEETTTSTAAATTTSHIPATEKNIKALKKANVPFTRVSRDAVVDQKFASNKYVPYDYAERAYNDLAVTKGKGFTKEKNKKKRGSYRGGAISLEAKGIKFED